MEKNGTLIEKLVKPGTTLRSVMGAGSSEIFVDVDLRRD